MANCITDSCICAVLIYQMAEFLVVLYVVFKLIVIFIMDFHKDECKVHYGHVLHLQFPQGMYSICRTSVTWNVLYF